MTKITKREIKNMTEQTIKTGDVIEGFQLKKISKLDNLKAVAYELEHIKSGAKLLHLHADDDENLLSIAFRTPPPNDTGLPHILEHSVLGGSKKYPVKEPFVELLKMSMATFINAMTYPDKTVYPIASNVKKNFWNLADVYFDAYSHPTITENTLKQDNAHMFLSMDPL
jgi:Zn-dependent M16 (insulinase) family peptidase